MSVEESCWADNVCVEVEGPYVSVGVQPWRLAVANLNRKVTRRGRITTWSPQSRKRFARTIGKLDQAFEHPVFFLTGTFSTEAAPGFLSAAKVWGQAWRKIKGRWTDAFAVYKKEPTEKLVPHIHAMVFGVPLAELGEFRREFGKWWCAAAQAYGCYVPKMAVAATNVEVWRSKADAAVYLTKELGKLAGVSEVRGEPLGRVWGVKGRREYKETVAACNRCSKKLKGMSMGRVRVYAGIVDSLVRREISKRVKVISSAWALMPGTMCAEIHDIVCQYADGL